MKTPRLALLASASLALLVAACGGGGGQSSTTTSTSQSAGTGASPNATSSGTISAFGSVFVNGHEFATTKATVVDDDTGTSQSGVSGLEVGEVVDVRASGDSSEAHPDASELHLHPLVRGYVDALDSGNQIVTVMGQSVQLDSATLFSDHRACLTAATNPCAAVTGLSGLTATTGSGASAVPGTYVRVDGYLYSGSTGSANVVATLVSVWDESRFASYPAVFKAEGPVSAVGSGTLTIGGLTVSTTGATCRSGGQTVACSFTQGQVVSAYAATAPSLPATAFTPTAIVLRSRVPVATAGTTIEVEGAASNVTTSPAGFTLRGMTVDATALPAGTVLPAAGDIVSVTGTLDSTGTKLVASSLSIEHTAASASYGFEGDVTSVAAGTLANTYTLGLMGQTIAVDAGTHLADRSQGAWFDLDPQSNPFNISTFQTYLAASTSQHVIVRTAADASGQLHALSVTIVPASAVDGVIGVVDASPAPANSTAATTPSTLSVHGLAISAVPSAISFRHGTSAIAAGDEVMAVGAYATGTLTIGAGATRTNILIDSGTLTHPADGDAGF